MLKHLSTKEINELIIEPVPVDQKILLSKFKDSQEDYDLLLEDNSDFSDYNLKNKEKNIKICIFVSSIHEKKYMYIKTINRAVQEEYNYFYEFKDVMKKLNPQWLIDKGLDIFMNDIEKRYLNWNLEKDLSSKKKGSRIKI